MTARQLLASFNFHSPVSIHWIGPGLVTVCVFLIGVAFGTIWITSKYLDIPTSQSSSHQADLNTFLVDGRVAVGNAVDFLMRPLDELENISSEKVREKHNAEIINLGAFGLLAFLFSLSLWRQNQARRIAESRLIDSEEQIAALGASANVGLWYWDVGSREIWITNLCRQIFGLRQNENPQRSGIFEAADSEEIGALRSVISTIASSGHIFNAEQWIFCQGRGRWLHIEGRLLPLVQGKRRRVAGIVMDVTDQKRTQQQMMQQNQQLTHLLRVGVMGELSGALAHELNQPLTSILSNAQAAARLLDKEPTDMRQVKEILGDIVSENHRAGDVIQRLRALLKKDKTQFEHVNGAKLISGVLELLHSEIVLNNVKVSQNLRFDLPDIYGDPVQLQQVLLNLILNACDAMSELPPPKRLLFITVSKEETAFVKLAVSDNGNGIPTAHINRIFDPFFTTKERGMGLGLSISRSIAEGHGGKLWAKNNKNMGTTFYLTLPIVQTLAAAPKLSTIQGARI